MTHYTSIAAKVRDQHIELSVAVYVGDRNGLGVVAARAIGYCCLEGAVAIAQQHSH
jgi:hypothetical protein